MGHPDLSDEECAKPSAAGATNRTHEAICRDLTDQTSERIPHSWRSSRSRRCISLRGKSALVGDVRP
jgi:hypothetical protein